MRRLALAGLSIVLAACGSAASPSPGGSSSPDPSVSAPPAEGLILRTWTTQALPPPATFSMGSSLVIADGKVITPGAMILIYPGPLVPPLIERPITQDGISRILEAANAAGMLSGPEDLTGGIAPGGVTGHILFVLGGQEREVIGDPGKQIVCIQAPCTPPAGTPEAFGTFWALLSDVSTLAQGELGPEQPHIPSRVAVLITDPPADDPGLEPGIAQWPLTTPIREFGAETGTADDRCGIVGGAELPAFLAAAGQANQLTRWTDGTTGGRVLVVRPLLPGEPDPCA
jgi:hypothetical protein